MLWWLLLHSFSQEITASRNIISRDVDYVTDSIQSCELGWYSFKEKCYKVGGRKKMASFSFEESIKQCVADGGNLATVNSKEIQEFLEAVILMNARRNLWIGINDRENESQYIWADGTDVEYTNWEPSEPSGLNDEKEDCAEMVFLSSKGLTGAWNDIDCTSERPFLCQKDMTEMLSSKKPLDPKFCSEDSSGWKFQDSCYIIVSNKKTWHEAEKFCDLNYSGHLITIKDFSSEMFVNYMLKGFPEEVWLGIEIKESFQQRWSSGWFVSYSNWDKEGDFVKGTCVIRLKGGKWGKVPCARKFSFMCETSSVSAPFLTPSVNGSTCPKEPSDWRDLGGDYCYHFEISNKATFAQANFICTQRGGYQASFHSQTEIDVIEPFFKYREQWIYLGLIQQMHGDMEFIWMDRSELDYIAWDTNEPNREDEQCGELKIENMKWNDIKCDHTKAYICSVKKIPPELQPELTTLNPEMATAESKQSERCPKKFEGSISPTVLSGIIVGSILVGILTAVIFYWFRVYSKRLVERRKPSVPSSQIPRKLVPRYSCRAQAVVHDDGEYYENI